MTVIAPWAWSRPPQIRLKMDEEIIVDNFAGGGGASMGIEQALGRSVDVAINHDPEAIAMHMANHPETEHYCEDVFEVDPVAACKGRPVGLAWFSPDCKHFSKAKGGRPVEKKIRGLAWVAVRWAAKIRPRVIVLENVEEFQTWGPLTKDDKPCPKRKGLTFRRWVRELERLGYVVDWRELRACDFGAPTIRKRLFLIARCDGAPIVWPEPTHGDGLEPYHTAAECIDWSLPCPSIFDRKRPLAEATLQRIARGIHRFVLESKNPFLMSIDHQSDKNGVYAMDAPLTTITGKARHCLVAAFLAKHYGGNYSGPGVDVRRPTSTVTATDHHALVCTHLLNMKGSDRRMRDIQDPVPTVCAGGNHAALVAALMAPYYGSGSGTTGRDLRDPSPTITSKDRLQLVTVTIDGSSYMLVDIGMRMLQPRELYRAQGFPDSYIIDPVVRGKPLTKTAQVRMCGNSVSPPTARAIISANMDTTYAEETVSHARA